jgi:2-polyprenyl-3-methyl-5-hydroxy-6-metoxy-1,4-benzoquinol methylase
VCGERRAYRFATCTFTGIDTSIRQLERHPNLDERIVGDVQEHRFDRGSFDVVIAWQLLEHLPRPDRALSRFCDALDDGGLLVLGLRNVLRSRDC